MLRTHITLKFLFSAALTGIIACAARAQITIADQGRSTLGIVIAETAPTSVQAAARELQRDLKDSTGAQLPILKDSENVKKPFISLGSTRQAKSENLSAAEIDAEGFRILTQDGNLFILGPDTVDGQWTAGGGTSHGTANGVYTFLEDYLGVRRLMPGEIGRVVPRRSTLVLEKIDRRETPLFISRKLAYLVRSNNMVNDTAPVNAWENFQKLGFSINLRHAHNWVQTVPASLYEQHPDWFAMKDGKRALPTGSRYKLETTNPELVRFFAQQAIDALKANPQPQTFSLSPSDEGGWSESPESQALYDPPQQNGKPATSSLVLKFYHDVAQIVAREYPEGRLAGYLYSDYLYPPTKVAMKLPDNFTPIIAPSSITYGYRLYHPANRDEWNHVMGAWAKVAPETWVYYDIANAFNLWRIPGEDDRMTGTTGIVTPAAPKILNFIFAGLRRNNVRGGYFFGTPSWSNSALANYVLAKMMWNPQLDAYEVQRDWLHNAYGAQAGEAMERFYQRLDGVFEEYSQDKIISSRPNDAMFKALYGDHYSELEKLFLAAKNQPMSAPQQARLQMIEDNLRVLQWRLRNAGFLADDFSSPLRSSTAQINALLLQPNGAFEFFPEALIGWSKRGLTQLPAPKVLTVEKLPNSTKPSTFAPSENQFVLLHAAQTGTVHLLPRQVRHGSLFAPYTIVDAAGKTVSNGLLDSNAPIIFPVEAGDVYYLYFPSRPGTSFEIAIENAAVAPGHFQNGVLTLEKHPAPVTLFYAPRDGKSERLHISQQGDDAQSLVTISRIQH